MRYFVNFRINADTEIVSFELTETTSLVQSGHGLTVVSNVDHAEGVKILSYDENLGGFVFCSDLVKRKQTLVPEGESLSCGETYNVSSCQFRVDEVLDSPVVKGRDLEMISLKKRAVLFGNSKNCDVFLESVGIGNTDFCEVYPIEPSGWFIERKSSDVVLKVNGKGVQADGENGHLTYGDIVNIEGYYFEFRADNLQLVDSSVGSWLDTNEVSVVVGDNKTILDRASLQITPKGFYGVLGGSGQGKSTLLNCLSGSSAATKGEVLLDGELVRNKIVSEPGSVGYVPQDDIVHRELKVTEALYYAAKLRLPSSVPKAEIYQLIAKILADLDLTEHADKKVGKLSGGQRKRVSIASELLSRPLILFLDEPTSGLDPATEQEVMALLREKANEICPVVCTTHILGEAHLFDEIFFINKGKIVYRGEAHGACDFFDAESLTDVYRKLKEQAELEEVVTTHHEQHPRELSKAEDAKIERKVKRPNFLACIKTLIQRQTNILKGAPFDVGLLIFQAVALGGLVGWGVENMVQRTFLIILASIWFGCSNASQAIVKELEVLRRESLAGLSSHAYLVSKLFFWTLVTTLQVSLFWVVVQTFVMFSGHNQVSLDSLLNVLQQEEELGSGFITQSIGHILYFAQIGEYIDSYKANEVANSLLTVLGLKAAIIFAGCLVGVSIGLLISSSVKSIVSAVLMVPVIILPQIPLSGSMISLPTMSNMLRFVSLTTPCAQLKQIGDGAEIYGMERPKVLNFTDEPLYVREKAGPNEKEGEEEYEVHPMNNAWVNHITEPNPENPHVKLKRTKLDEAEGASTLQVEKMLSKNSIYEVFASNRSDVRLREGQYFTPSSYEVFGYSFYKSFGYLLIWVIGCYAGAICFIRKNVR